MVHNGVDLEDNIGNTLLTHPSSDTEEEDYSKYDLIKIRRRIEETLRTMDRPKMLLHIARLLNIKLN